MAETAVSLAGQHALSKILEAVKMLRDLPKEVRDITDELESFQDFINDADKMAEAEEDDGRRHRIKERVMRLREAAFRMEDAIDEYNISCEDKQPDDPRCAALLCEAVDFIKTQILRLQNEVVGLDGPRGILKNWLTKGREKRTVISVVGIPGVGKTTLAKQVYDQEDRPKDVSTIESLTEEVRNRLCNKRYVVLFDDVWNGKFWDHIESAVIENKNGSRILITTRDEKVAEYCRKSSFVEVHKLEKPLTEEESLKLFCKKAFQYSSDGDCPEELKDISLEIVRKCKVFKLPVYREISKLKKLRHLLSGYIPSIQWKDIGGMTSLQEIPPVIIDNDGVVIREVGKLKQLRELTVIDFTGKHKETLSSLINEMPLLEKLLIDTADESEVIDLYITSPMSTLRKLVLWGTLTRFPNWISQFPSLNLNWSENLDCTC
ncbi:Disease resistance RPP13-like protein 4 [Glycine soja]|uniref:Disease resistance RPP13-like protein 4 n=1 Tax=Glycine soja TaxID=3848 RepID=A0A445FQY8_GLYSO|nr:Disease resistance RPP13-like protein 4 [Glycine soja]